MIPVVLSGGSGSRLWPVSREGHPKPFMRLPDGETLLEKTYHRAAAIAAEGEIITVTNRDYYFMSKDELEAVKKPGLRGTFVLEPVGRNTAAAIAMAALTVRATHGDAAVMVIMAADHLIGDTCQFNDTVSEAAALAASGRLVTFGIKPTAAETGFGYIEGGKPLGEGPGLGVSRFVEKPDSDTARAYVESGNYYWNSGMFCFTAGAILAELEKHAPEILKGALACDAIAPLVASGRAMLRELPQDAFEVIPDESIDYAVMEKSDRVAVIPSTFGWSDIGSWSALSQLVEPDAQMNRVLGDSVLVDTRRTYVQSEGRLVAAVGVEDLIIIDTEDALLVTRPSHVQDVKKVVQALKSSDHEAFRLHKTVSRPWGTYTVLEEGPCFKIKRIVVKPGASLSLQMHHHRSEHWIVVEGMAKVVNGDKELYVNTNESTYIPAGHKHRLENPGKLDLIMIEVQSGEYLGEDDIVRFEDVYGRV